MHLKVLTPGKTQYKGEVVSLNIKTLDGEITVLENHEPLISMFDKGTARIVDKHNKTVELEIGSGFLEKTPDNELNVLTE